MGTLFYKEEPLLILNPRELLNANTRLDTDNPQVIVMQTSYGYIGITVDALGEIPKYENHRLDRDPGVISESSKFISAMIKPEPDEAHNLMLLLLDPDGLVFHITGEELAISAA